ncbi:MAG: hypothetical protein V1847_04880 [Candidatus Diapherotrites archaeon]
MPEPEVEKLVLKIAEYANIPAEQVWNEITAKKLKYSGLLSDSGAAFMIAKEKGVQVEEGRQKRPIAELREGQNNIDIEGKVEQIREARVFESKGRKGQLQHWIVSDETGSIRITVWNRHIPEAEKMGIQKGDSVLLENCRVEKYNDKIQAQLNYNGKMVLELKGENKAKKVSELTAGENAVDVIVRIGKRFPSKPFAKAERQGSVQSFFVEDESGSIRATAWNEIIPALEKMKEGSVVRIENAYTKQGLKGVELHLGWQSRIQALPNVELKTAHAPSPKNFDECAEGELLERRATIVDVLSKQPFFEACTTCGKKVQQVEENWVCAKCGQTNAVKRAILGIALDDGSAVLRASLFGETAEQLLSKKGEELDKIDWENEKGKLKGKELVFAGSVRLNKLNGEKELNVQSVSSAEPEREAGKILSEI